MSIYGQPEREPELHEMCVATGDHHEWKVDGVHLAVGGGALWVRCVWCDTVQFEPGLNYRKSLLGE